MEQKKQANLMRGATYASVATAFFLILIKFIAFLFTGSVSLLSSLIDSILDSLASIINLFAVRASLEPADKEHRFGHGKAEPLAGLAQAAFVMGSSLFLIVESFKRFVHPEPVEHGSIGILVMLISLGATIVLVLYQRYVVKQTGSLAIQADSIHYFSDIALNVGVILSLFLSAYVAWTLADPIFALLIAGYIIVSAWNIVSQSLDQLMDRELSDEERSKIKNIIASHAGVIGMHDLRTRASGKDIFIQAHIDMDAEMSLYDAHQISEAVESELQVNFPTADILIHQDPVERKD
ncbi:MAG: cation diffusion facilitator family transporter [Gammaproteobacteria bacterium]|nr:cation diffusion facilitator family transporter [Gammaproteobacteria bacterium]